MNYSFTTRIATRKKRGAPTFFGEHLFIILTREPDILYGVLFSKFRRTDGTRKLIVILLNINYNN